MAFEITKELLQVALPQYDDDYDELLGWIKKYFDAFGIDTKDEIVDALATIAIESRDLTRLEENLHYRAETLLKNFPKYFTPETAEAAAGDPEMTANIAYANRYGNGDYDSGDGYRFRGRSGVQLTFRYNYQLITNDTGIDFVNNPDLLCTPEYAVMAVAWFWKKKNVDAVVLKGSLEAVRIRINGGLNGYPAFEKRVGEIRDYLDEQE
jgi:putative chitinase